MRRLAARVLVAPVDLEQLSSAAHLVRLGVGGLILFGSRVPPDLAAQLSAARSAASLPVEVMADEEGGAIQRLRMLVGELPSARDMARTMTTHEITATAARAGRALEAAGVTVDLAPVLDLDDGPGPDATHPDGTRSFSADVGRATTAGLAFASGLESAGVVPVVKHFPGLGGASGNTDTAAATTLPWSALRASGLLPFRAAVEAAVPAVMVSNAVVPGLSDVPASLSSQVVDGALRGELGFGGLVITDSLSADAIDEAGYTLPQAAVAALGAGADLVLFGHAHQRGTADLVLQLRAAITRAVETGGLSRGRLEEAVGRALSLRPGALGQRPGESPLCDPRSAS